MRLAVVRRQSETVAAALIGRARIGPVRSHAWLLNQSGNSDADSVYIEDNDLLCVDQAAAALLLTQLPGNWDELYVSGSDPQSTAGRVLEAIDRPFRLTVERIPAPFVDLAAIARGGHDYLDALSSNTRAQIRRSYRLYGPVTLDVAAGQKEALEIYDELAVLHRHGAFQNRWFRRFHRALIERRFDSGEIQLIRVRGRGRTIGCLYNFVWNGTTFYYQGGFWYEEDNRLKPGLVSHTEAIRHNVALGHVRYDFMASRDLYKLQLATGQRELVWARVQKPRIKFAIERAFRAALDRYCRVRGNT